MPVVLSDRALMDEATAAKYLRDQGYPTDGGDMLRLHINAVSGFIARVTGREALKYSDTQIVELRDGDDTEWIYTREAPIRSLVSVETYPYETNYGETITGPGTSAYNDDAWYEARGGRVVLKNTTLPQGKGTVLITYTAGFYDDGDAGVGEAADPELSALKVIALEALLRKWQRWTEKRVGVASRSSDAGSITYSQDDFPKAVVAELLRYRRQWVA